MPRRHRHQSLNPDAILAGETLEKPRRKSRRQGLEETPSRRFTSEELLALRVQTMPALLRSVLVLSATAHRPAWFAWPLTPTPSRRLEVISGIFAILFGAFGIRRTLSHVLDSVDAIDLAGSILKSIAEAVSNIDL